MTGLRVDQMSTFDTYRGRSGFCEQSTTLNKLKPSACGNKSTSCCNKVGRTLEEKSDMRAKAPNRNGLSSAVLVNAPEKAAAVPTRVTGDAHDVLR